MSTPPRVLIIGAGATGACAALRIRQTLGRGGVHLEVWEKARGAGGRMSTTRQELRGVSVRADMGAQCLSLDGADVACAGVADLLVSAGVVADVPASRLSRTAERPTGTTWRHLAGTAGGVNDALKALFEEAAATVHYEKRVASIDDQQGCWRARPFEGAPGVFDAVVLAVPGCGVGGDNLNKIHGSWESCLTAEQSRRLQSAQHDARWSFALFFPASCTACCDAFFGAEAIEKVIDDGALHLLCYQSRKTHMISGKSPEGGVVVVAHTTNEWARRNARANGRDDRLLREVSERVATVLGSDTPPVASKVITWKQSQVSMPLASSDDGPCMPVSDNPPFVLAGDYFSESSFGGCLRSGFAAADVVAATLKGVASRASTEHGHPYEGKGKRTETRGGKGKGGGRKAGKAGRAAQAGKGWAQSAWTNGWDEGWGASGEQWW